MVSEGIQKKRKGKEGKSLQKVVAESMLFMSCSTGGRAIKDSRANGREGI